MQSLDKRINGDHGDNCRCGRFFWQSDSVNGSPGDTKGKLRYAVKPSSPHQEFWCKSIHIIKNIRYIATSSKLAKQAAKPRLCAFHPKKSGILL